MEIKKPFISSLVEGCIDSTVQNDLLKTYAKECISFIEYGNLSITNVDPQIINRVEFTECEISPFHPHDIECNIEGDADFCRAASTTNFKYRYRGYRQAIMEAGSMYQHATYASQSMDLRTTLWSTFSEPELMYALDLNHGAFLPLTMQLFGYEKL